MTDDKIYRALDTLDAKCSAVLQLAGIVLSIGTVPITMGAASDSQRWLSAMTAFIFLIASLLALYVLWFSACPDERVLQRRLAAYRCSLLLTGGGLVLIAGFVWAAALR